MHLLVEDGQVDRFQMQLAAISQARMKDPDLRPEYLIQSHGSLIGKQFKSLAQVMPYLVYNLVLQKFLDAWTTIGSLVILLWHTDIEDIDDYLVWYFTS